MQMPKYTASEKIKVWEKVLVSLLDALVSLQKKWLVFFLFWCSPCRLPIFVIYGGKEMKVSGVCMGEMVTKRW